MQQGEVAMADDTCKGGELDSQDMSIQRKDGGSKEMYL